jgi:coenzyme PQQ precursor peptide PqqA
MISMTQPDNPAGAMWELNSMAWRKPTVIRISVGCEINAYGCAVV